MQSFLQCFEHSYLYGFSMAIKQFSATKQRSNQSATATVNWDGIIIERLEESDNQMKRGEEMSEET